jgi:hypothetical protein
MDPWGSNLSTVYGFALSSSLVFLAEVKLRIEISPRVVLYSETAGSNLHFR